MAKNFSVALNLILNSADYTRSLSLIKKETEEFKGKLEGLVSGVKSLLGLGAAALTVESAFEVLKKGFESTVSSMESYEGVLLAVTESSNVFFRTLQNGNWGDFLTNLKEAVRMAKEYNEAMIYIENKSRGNSVANEKDKATVSELRLQAAELSGTKNYEARLKILAQIEKLEDGILERNLKLSQFNYDAQVDKLVRRGKTKGEKEGYSEADIADFAKFTQSGEEAVALLTKYTELKDKLKENFNADNAFSNPFKTGLNDEAVDRAEESEKIRAEISKLVSENPAIYRFKFLLSDVNKDEIKAISDASIRLYNDRTASNQRKLKVVKQEAMLNKKSDGEANKINPAYTEELNQLNKFNNEKLAAITEYHFNKDEIENGILKDRATSTITFNQEMLQQSIDYDKKQIELLKKYGMDTTALDLRLIQDREKLYSSMILAPKAGVGSSVKTKQEAGSINDSSVRDDGADKNDLAGSDAMNSAIHNTQAAMNAEDKLEQRNKALEESFKSLKSSLASFSTETIQTAFTALAESMVGVGDGFKNFGSKALESIGKFMEQMGAQMVTVALLYGAFENLMSNPASWPVALAVGIAAMAAGAAFVAMGQKGLASSGASSSGASSGASSSQAYNNSSQASANNKVVFEIQGTVLKGVLNNVDRRNLSIG